MTKRKPRKSACGQAKTIESAAERRQWARAIRAADQLVESATDEAVRDQARRAKLYAEGARFESDPWRKETMQEGCIGYTRALQQMLSCKMS